MMRYGGTPCVISGAHMSSHMPRGGSRLSINMYVCKNVVKEAIICKTIKRILNIISLLFRSYVQHALLSLTYAWCPPCVISGVHMSSQMLGGGPRLSINMYVCKFV
jgi:hypothetical protein